MGLKGFQYDLQFIDISDASADDVAQEVRGFQVRIAMRSAKYLEGATLDFKETLMEVVSLLKIPTRCGLMTCLKESQK